jgi:hypothetical protein
MKKLNIENRLLATHISANSDFEPACMSGDAEKIMAIVHTEMEKNNLFTAGSKKLRDDIFRMTKGRDKVSVHIGSNIMAFVWNSRLSGTGFAVC